jgi:tRNA acetyltransferase TAN1
MDELTHDLQTVCGMSVVGSDWEKLKRFNLAELYQQTKTPKVETTDEA